MKCPYCDGKGSGFSSFLKHSFSKRSLHCSNCGKEIETTSGRTDRFFAFIGGPVGIAYGNIVEFHFFPNHWANLIMELISLFLLVFAFLILWFLLGTYRKKRTPS